MPWGSRGSHGEKKDDMKLLIALFSMVMGMVAAGAGEDATEFARHFDYDRAMPLQIVQTGSKQYGGSRSKTLRYIGADGGRVPAYLVIPPGKGSFVAILWGHWMMPGSPYMNRTEFLEEAVVLAPSGVVSLLIDAPMVRPGAKAEGDDEEYKKVFREDVIDLRRGLDLLVARKDVDAARLGYVGHSFHAGAGGVLAGIDSRPKAFVLMAGGLDASRVLVSQSAYAVKLRQDVSEAGLKQFITDNPWMMRPATWATAVNMLRCYCSSAPMTPT